MPGTLFIVATPIGNLSDMTLRAIETLKGVDVVLCEDTRVTGKLLARYEIRKSMVSCHEHTDDGKLAHIVERLQGGESLAFASDAGTPGLSDPGNKLVSLALAAGISVVPIPGVSALATIISVAGIDMREFIFLGFPPHKKGRETFFRKVAGMEYPTVYYESPHRVMKNLDLLERLLSQENLEHLESSGRLGGKRVIIGRELTKMFEEVLRGSIGDIRNYFTANPGKMKGEFVIIVY